MSISSYESTIESMYKLKRLGIKLNLSIINSFLKKLGNPQNKLEYIHIAGTNGKGSVASGLSSILHNNGYRVGLFTSPHLVKFNERICINGIPISDKRIINLWKIIDSISNEIRELTFFEVSTVMAILEFKEKKVDFAIMETGMGGRLDATNIVKPILTIITNISIEHKEYLGNTIKEICTEKAGIIKNRIPIISGVSQKSAISVIEKIAHQKKSKFLLKGRDFRTRKNKDGTFTYISKYVKWSKMRTGLIGDHQIENSGLVLAACEVLISNNISLSIKNIKSGLYNNKWEGRLEIINKEPLIILDGAHNLMAVKKLKNFLKTLKNKKITLIIGILDDKPYKEMLLELVPLCSKIIITEPKNERVLKTEKLKTIIETLKKESKEIKDVGSALEYAVINSQKNDIICIAGSLYVIGEVKKKLNSK